MNDEGTLLWQSQIYLNDEGTLKCLLSWFHDSSRDINFLTHVFVTYERGLRHGWQDLLFHHFFSRVGGGLVLDNIRWWILCASSFNWFTWHWHAFLGLFFSISIHHFTFFLFPFYVFWELHALCASHMVDYQQTFCTWSEYWFVIRIVMCLMVLNAKIWGFAWWQGVLFIICYFACVSPIYADTIRFLHPLSFSLWFFVTVSVRFIV